MRWSPQKREWQGVRMKQHLNIRAIDRGESLRGTDELAYMDGVGNEVRGTSLQHVYRNDALVGDPLEERRQIRLHGLHPRGKELSLFSSTGCETIGWMSV
jgi:hypothetical protein